MVLGGGRRQWCAVDGMMAPSNGAAQPLLCHLENWHNPPGFDVVWQYLMETIR